ncbi:MAG: hypothetical protein HC838_00375 [Spirulinaceae cyanobacterium RM2_2_10]|nr:hypothetical protein [Spirulinaceae cyanobacterium SM2_1_0]NJO18819.1 hypothetical protein [Spirulinaceae cyanobacterium RM2_2_10]
MLFDRYDVPSNSDDYEVIIIRRKPSDSRPPNPVFSVILALIVSYFTVWIFTEEPAGYAPAERRPPTQQVQS